MIQKFFYETKPYSWGQPLAHAAGHSQYEIAELLLERGADPTLAGADWATPLARAEKKGYGDIADLIKRYL